MKDVVKTCSPKYEEGVIDKTISCILTKNECPNAWDCPENWLNKNFDGVMHKALMIMESRVGIPDTKEKQNFIINKLKSGIEEGLKRCSY